MCQCKGLLISMNHGAASLSSVGSINPYLQYMLQCLLHCRKELGKPAVSDDGLTVHVQDLTYCCCSMRLLACT